MELIIKNVNIKNKKIKEIYLDSFPKEDRMPFWLMVLLSKKNDTDFLAFYDEEILCGFTYTAIKNNIAFVMFFAIDKNLRSKGYGSFILNKLQSIYPNHKIIVSIEPFDENAKNINQRIRRKKFYINNGYVETGYLMNLSNIEQEILIKNGNFDKEEFLIFFKKYSNGTVRPEIWKNVKKC